MELKQQTVRRDCVLARRRAEMSAVEVEADLDLGFARRRRLRH